MRQILSRLYKGEALRNFVRDCFVVALLLLAMTLNIKPAHAANSGNFTMSLWVNPATSVASKALVSKAEEFRMFTNASGFVGCQIKTTTWQTAAQSTTKALVVGSWSHVLCTYDLTKLTVYVNGVQTAQTSLTSLPDDTAAVLRIGQDDSASTTYTNLAGTVDEFKFYPYALTSDEVKTEYNHGSALVLGNLSTNSSYSSNATNQTYCVPGDTTSCAAPVAEWSFDDGSGSTVADSSGNSNTGTWSGTGNHWTAGKIGKAGKFNGSDDYVKNSTSDFRSGDSMGTVEAWIKTNTNGNIVTTADESSGNYYWLFGVSSGKLLVQQNNSGTVDAVTGSSTLTDSLWHHVVLASDGSVYTMYVDGKLETLTVTSGTNSGDWFADTSSRDNVVIGVLNRSTLTSYFNGSIDQVRIFNYARTPAQIAWDYNRGGPVAHYKMDECSGTAIHDSSGNGNTGTLTLGSSGQTAAGTCDGSAGTSWKDGASGKYNASLDFDGTDDYIENTSLTGTNKNEETVSVWVRPNTIVDAHQIVSMGHGSGVSGNYLIIGQNGADAQFKLYTTTYRTITASDVLSQNTWVHLTIVHSVNQSRAELYVNGNLAGTMAYYTDNSNNHSFINIGRDSSAANYFSGQIDDVRIFNYALTATQVKTLFNENSAVRFGPASGTP